MGFPSSLIERLRPRLRNLLRQTPPCYEEGWGRAIERLPGKEESTWDGLVEVYNASDDMMSFAYYWSLPSVTSVDARHYFWRPIPPGQPNDRHFEYYRRASHIFN
jgi:hypothetical protein